MRPLYAALSMAVALALFVGLSQSESRSIYQGYDKWLHASVFFLLWWLARISLRWHTLAISLAVVALGGAEELRQAFTPGRTADWGDIAANTAGVLLAALLYSALRGLWVARPPTRWTGVLIFACGIGTGMWCCWPATAAVASPASSGWLPAGC